MFALISWSGRKKYIIDKIGKNTAGKKCRPPTKILMESRVTPSMLSDAFSIDFKINFLLANIRTLICWPKSYLRPGKSSLKTLFVFFVNSPHPKIGRVQLNSGKLALANWPRPVTKPKFYIVSCADLFTRSLIRCIIEWILAPILKNNLLWILLTLGNALYGFYTVFFLLIHTNALFFLLMHTNLRWYL